MKQRCVCHRGAGASFEFSHARIKIAVHVGSVGVMISKLVIDQVFLVRIVSVLDERDNLIVQWDKYAGGVYSERREMLNGRKRYYWLKL